MYYEIITTKILIKYLLFLDSFEVLLRLINILQYLIERHVFRSVRAVLNSFDVFVTF